jgi:acetyl esterase
MSINNNNNNDYSPTIINHNTTATTTTSDKTPLLLHNNNNNNNTLLSSPSPSPEPNNTSNIIPRYATTSEVDDGMMDDDILHAIDPLLEADAEAIEGISRNSTYCNNCCWCCPIINCMCGGIMGGKNALPFKVRALDCIAKFLFWCSGMYEDEKLPTTPHQHQPTTNFSSKQATADSGNNNNNNVPSRITKFKRNRWDLITQLNETKPRTIKGVGAKDLEIPSSVEVNLQIPIRIYDMMITTTTTSSTTATTPTKPIMFLIHGGGFCIGSRATKNHDELCRRYVSEAGFVVVSVSYRLAPEHPFPAAVHDCYDVLRWIHDPLRSGSVLPHNVDRSRIVLAGDSAGGNLACVLSSLVRDGLDSNLKPNAIHIRIAHLVLFYPVLFLSSSDRSNTTRYNQIRKPKEFINPKMGRWFLSSYLPDLDSSSDPSQRLVYLSQTERRLNPFAVTTVGGGSGAENLPPTTIVSAELDMLHYENRIAAEMLQKAGVPCVLRHYTNVVHGFVTFSFLPEADRCFQETLCDLQHVINRSENIIINSRAMIVSPLPKLGEITTTNYGRGRVISSNEKDGIRVAFGMEFILWCGSGMSRINQFRSGNIEFKTSTIYYWIIYSCETIW